MPDAKSALPTGGERPLDGASLALPGQQSGESIPTLRQALTSTRVIASLVGITALGLDLYRLGAPSLWFDELLSVSRASQPLPVLWQIITHTQPNMALYYFLLDGWLRLTSALGLTPTEAVVRLPSAFFAAGAAVLVFLLARRFFNLLPALCAVLLYIASNLQLLYAQQTRSYGLQLLLLMLGWYALLNVLSGSAEQPRRRWLFCYVGAMTLAVYAHFFSLLIFAAQVVSLLGLLLLPTPWRPQVRRLFRPLLLSLASVVILVIPMLILSTVGAKTGWIPVPDWKAVVRLFVTFADTSRSYLALLLVLGILGLLISLLVSTPRGQHLLTRLGLLPASDSGSAERRLSGYQRLAAFNLVMFCWLSVPILLSYAISQVSVHLFLDRYLVTVIAPFFFLAVAGVVALRWQPVRVALIALLALMALRYVPFYYSHAELESWRPAALWVEDHYQSGDGLVCYDNAQGCQLGLEYYFQAYPSPAHVDSSSPGSFPWVQYDLTNTMGDTQQAVNIEAVAHYAAHHAHLFYIVARLPNDQEVAEAAAVVAWLNAHEHLTATFHTRTVSVYLYDTHP